MRGSRPLLALLLCTAVCGGDGASSDGGTSGTSGTSGTTSPTSGSTGSATASTATGTTGAQDVLATGIDLIGVRVNQAVDIEVMAAGIGIAPADRVAPTIGGRPMLVRAEYTLDAAFEPREIVGRLSLESGGETITYDHLRAVTGPSDMTTLGGTFQWMVDAADVRGDTAYAVELLEADAASAPSGDVSGARFPAVGAEDLGAWGDPMELDIVLVPFFCPGFGAQEVTPTDVQDLEAFIYNTYPVQVVNVTVHDIVDSVDCSEFDAAETLLPELRAGENADPWVYYGGVMPGNGGGYSVWAGDSDQMDFRRTFANHAWRFWGLSFDLFAHELGHNHDRDHTFEDPDYPHHAETSCGARVTYGFGIMPANIPQSAYSNDQDLGQAWIDPNATLIAPSTVPDCYLGNGGGNLGNFNDMMSYAYPYWISAYTYAALAERIKLITSWKGGGLAAAPESRVLRVIDGPNGVLVREAAGSVGEADLAVACVVDGKARELPARSYTTHLDKLEAGRLQVAQRFHGVEIEMPDAADVTCGATLGATSVIVRRPTSR